ncbi:MAG: MOSC domain-containing protein [Thermoanaerobacterales bacterium]|jgi:MOSC domain-containing protein YiiM|nr:MOSC domain-containing protein [Thermoanaerobacterales bacterium]
MAATPSVTGVVAGVFVGRPRPLGRRRGRVVRSAIAKSRVDAPELELGTTNLAGDRQADLRVHGGPDKAVYVYPVDHYPAWRDEGFALDVGDLGENVALAGLTERDVLLGDVLRWGEALVQVSQPRSPCYKLALHTGRRDVGPRMIATARCGWYLRVLAPGTVPTSGAVELVERQPGAPSVRDAFTVMFAADGERDLALAERVLASPALGEGWRTPLAARISGERR